jgi:hypothetical protein
MWSQCACDIITYFTALGAAPLDRVSDSRLDIEGVGLKCPCSFWIAGGYTERS